MSHSGSSSSPDLGPWGLLSKYWMEGQREGWREKGGRGEDRERDGGTEGRMGKGRHSGEGAQTPQDSDLHPCCGSSGGHWSLHLHSGSLGAGFLGIERKVVHYMACLVWFLRRPLQTHRCTPLRRGRELRNSGPRRPGSPCLCALTLACSHLNHSELGSHCLTPSLKCLSLQPLWG